MSDGREAARKEGDMNWKAIAIASLAAGALLAPAPVLAQSAYTLRNDTHQTQNCRLNRPHSTIAERFVLRPGGEWSEAALDSTSRRLVCDVGREPLQANLRPGRHALVLDRETGRVVVRIAVN
jgi:hypothetical protein